MNTDDYAPEIKRLIKEFVNDYLRSPEFRQQLESIMGEEEKYLTREELCRYARLSPSTLWRIEKRQTIPHTMVGGRKLYAKKEVDRLIAEGRLSLYSQQNQETSKNRRLTGEQLAFLMNNLSFLSERKESASPVPTPDRKPNLAMERASMCQNPKPLFDPFWYEGEIGCLFADSNVGKSILAMQIAAGIAKEQRVLYFDFELSEKQFQLRYTDENGKLYRFPDKLFRVTINPDLLGALSVPFEEAVMGSIEKAACHRQHLHPMHADRKR